MNWLFFCKLSMGVPYFCKKKKKNSLSMNGHNFGLSRLSHQKHFALWFLDEVFCSIFEIASFGWLNSFWIAAVCFITDSEMPMTFCKEKSAPSLNNLCCVWWWFIPHTEWSLNIESKELPYSQFWWSGLSSAMYYDTLSSVFLQCMLTLNLSGIGFLFGFSWIVMLVTHWKISPWALHVLCVL